MVRTARLLERSTGKYLEEVPYCNVYTQSVQHQLLNDFESILSNSIRTGIAIPFSDDKFSLEAVVSSFITNPREVHIPLKDLFSVCKSNAFTMATTGGLRVELELEPEQKLFQLNQLPQKVPLPPQEFINAEVELPVIGFIPQSQTNFRSFLAPAQRGDAPTTPFIPLPLKNYSEEGYLYTQNYLLDYVDVSHNALFNGYEEGGNILRLKPAWTAQNFADLYISAGNLLQINFVNRRTNIDTGNIEEINFHRICKISSITSTAGTDRGNDYGSALVLDEYFIPSQTFFTGWTTIPVSFFLFSTDISANNFAPSALYLTTGTASEGLPVNVDTLIATNTLLIKEPTVLYLFQKKILVGPDLETLTGAPNAKFKLAIKNNVVVSEQNTVYCENDINPESQYGLSIDGIKRNTSNQSLNIPFTTNQVRIVSCVRIPETSNFLLTFENLFLNGYRGPWSYSIQPASAQYPQGLPVESTVAEVVMYGIQLREVGQVLNTDYTFNIDRAEIVLIKGPVPKSFKMNPLYETKSVEMVDIQTELLEFHRQFILDANCFNAILLTPQWTNYELHTRSILSSTRNIARYRFYIDQIQNTNRLIEVMSDQTNYISPLHIEKMFESFVGAGMALRSLQGLKAVETMDRSVVCFPIKIYAGRQMMQGSNNQPFVNYIPNNQTHLLQVDLYALNELHKILPAPIFLFKNVIKSF